MDILLNTAQRLDLLPNLRRAGLFLRFQVLDLHADLLDLSRDLLRVQFDEFRLAGDLIQLLNIVTGKKVLKESKLAVLHGLNFFDLPDDPRVVLQGCVRGDQPPFNDRISDILILRVKTFDKILLRRIEQFFLFQLIDRRLQRRQGVL